MNSTIEILQRELLKAIGESAEMVGYALIASLIFGTLLGLILYLTSNPLFFKNRLINSITGIILFVQYLL